jgi:hypothetical protein
MEMTQARKSVFGVLVAAVVAMVGVVETAQAKDGPLWDIGLGYASPSYSTEVDRSGAAAAAVDFSVSWKLADSTRLGIASHALADAYKYVDTADNEYSLTINQVLLGASLRQSFGNDNQGLFARADLGLVTTSAKLTINDVETEVPGESGFGFLARVGYGITASGDFNIAPQLSFGGYALSGGFNSSVEFGAAFTF